jgi:hypothetical protein
MLLILISDVFVKDQFYDLYSATTAYEIWSTIDLNSNQIMPVLCQLLNNVTLLAEVLSTIELSAEDKKLLYKEAIVMPNKAIDVLIEYVSLNHNDLIDVLGYGWRNRAPVRSLKTLGKKVRYSLNDMCYCFGTDGLKLDRLISLGADINVLGDIHLFQSLNPQVDIDTLLNRGYDIEPVARIYAQRVSDMQYTGISVQVLKRFRTKLNAELSRNKTPLSSIHPDKLQEYSVSDIAWSMCFVTDNTYMYDSRMFNREPLLSGRSLWIKELQLAMINQSRYSYSVKLLETYIRVLLKYSCNVICKGTYSGVIIYIDRCTITLSFKCYKGKYKALDVFSEEGKVLVKRKHIKDRRAELLRILPIR